MPHLPHEIFRDISGKFSTVLITSHLILVNFSRMKSVNSFGADSRKKQIFVRRRFKLWIKFY